MASQNAVKRAQNTRLAAARSSLTISLMILWAAMDMADETSGFKVIWPVWFHSGKISAWEPADGISARLSVRTWWLLPEN